MHARAYFGIQPSKFAHKVGFVQNELRLFVQRLYNRMGFIQLVPLDA